MLEKTHRVSRKTIGHSLDAIAPTLTESLPIDNISKETSIAKGNDCTLNQYLNRYSDIEQIYRDTGECPNKGYITRTDLKYTSEDRSFDAIISQHMEKMSLEDNY